MDRRILDRIIVESNAKMLKVINWYLDNKDWLDKEEFQTPIERGVIILQEERIDIVFDKKDDDLVELSIYAGEGRKTSNPNRLHFPAVLYDYRPSDHWLGNYRFPASSKEKIQMMKMLLDYDKTDLKECIKYHALMMFASYYKEIVKVDGKQSVKRTKHEAKMLRRSHGQPLQLVKKTYVLSDFDEKKLPNPNGKRSYTKPDHEVSVRGYYRTYKSGKRCWVKPFVRYKDKGNGRAKEYIV